MWIIITAQMTSESSVATAQEREKYDMSRRDAHLHKIAFKSMHNSFIVRIYTDFAQNHKQNIAASLCNYHAGNAINIIKSRRFYSEKSCWNALKTMTKKKLN
jgi:hypothetical protein